MKNSYEIRDNTTVIFLKIANGKILETLIDTSDFEKVDSYPGTWFASWCPKTATYNVYGVTTIKGKRKNFYLHRFLLDAPKGIIVDHINHNTLDNRRSNLRLVTNAQNMQNRKGPNRNNQSSGHRGVTWDKNRKKWVVKIAPNGKTINLGRFDDKRKAIQVAVQAIAQYMPFSLEAMHF